MKLTEKQRQALCTVFERAMTTVEKYGVKPLLISFEIDQYHKFDTRVYEDNYGHLTRLAGDRCDVYDVDTCIRTIEELEQYCDTFLNNRNEAKKARIEALEKELATLKSMED